MEQLLESYRNSTEHMIPRLARFHIEFEGIHLVLLNFLFSAEDCAVAAGNMMLAAHALGIGSCYIGQGWAAFSDPYGQEILHKWQIRPDYYAVMQLLLGYPREGDNHPSAKPRKKDRILRF